ncbi:MAG: hypothetical protein FJ293_04155 [Planctomycetes bacterium]|nr:hypothetical protein [Planctomycetota bacterium]
MDLIAGHLLYQAIDLLLATALWLACAALSRGAIGRRLLHRLPPWLGRAPRGEWLLAAALFVGGLGGVIFFGQSLVYPALDHLLQCHPDWQRRLNVGAFLPLGIAWLGGTIVLPAAALRAAWSARRDRGLAAGFALAMATLLLLACIVEPDRVVVERRRVEVAGLPAGVEPLRVVLLSDLQSSWLGPRERALPARVAALRPDLIVVAGDLVAQSFDERTTLRQARHVLQGLVAAAPRLGVHVVNGDVDSVVHGGIAETIRGTGALLLDNQSVVLATEPPIELLGIDPRRAGAMERALARAPRAAVRIGLVHRPRHWRDLAAAGCQLVLAGHTHGGQVVIPGFGPPVTFEIVPRAVAAGGLHRMSDTTQLCVTRGLGKEGGFAPQIRLFCPPEITLIEVTGAPMPPH